MKKNAAVLCFALLLASGFAHADDNALIREANAALAQKDYLVAFPKFLTLAQQGNAPAQFNVGAFYLNGQGIQKDEKLAEEWFEKSAAQGNARALQVLQKIAAKRNVSERTALNQIKPQTPTAQTQPPVPAKQAAVNDFYVAVDMGRVRYSNTASTYDKGALPNPYALKIAGGYRLNRQVGVEAGYTFIGDSSLKSTGAVVVSETLKASVIHLAAVGTYAINDSFDVFGKLGLAYTSFDYSYSSTTSLPASGSGKGSKTNPMFGLGAQYNFNMNYSIRTQYENFGKASLTNTFNDGTSTKSDIGLSMVSVGGAYRF